MIAVVQRVDKASVTIGGESYSQINKGILILLGIVKKDSLEDVKKLSEKIINLRIMTDDDKKMNRSIVDVSGEIMVVSQFTLAANLKSGRRPDFFPAMEPKTAKSLYDKFIKILKDQGTSVKTGLFSAYMKIELINDGPVTFILNSRDL